MTTAIYKVKGHLWLEAFDPLGVVEYCDIPTIYYVNIIVYYCIVLYIIVYYKVEYVI